MLNESLEGSGSKFKLGLDIHGVCDSMPELFSFLTDSFIKNGGEVHIITGGHWNDDFESLLNNLGVKWTHKFSVYDYLIESGSKIFSFQMVQFKRSLKMKLGMESNLTIVEKTIYHYI